MTDKPEQSRPGRGPHAPMAGGTPGQHAGPHPIPRQRLPDPARLPRLQDGPAPASLIVLAEALARWSAGRQGAAP